MSPVARIAVGGALAGLMLTLAVVSARHQPAAAPPIAAASEMPGLPASVDMAHCRAATMPEAECEAAWDARRRHFFGEDAAMPDSGSVAP